MWDKILCDFQKVHPLCGLDLVFNMSVLWTLHDSMLHYEDGPPGRCVYRTEDNNYEVKTETSATNLQYTLVKSCKYWSLLTARHNTEQH
jgi:hypothetical protein